MSMGRYLGHQPVSKPEPKPKKKKPAADDGRVLLRGCGRLILVTFQLAVIGLILAVIGLVGGYVYLNHELSGAIEQVVHYQGQGPGGTPRFYDRYGNLLFELQTAEKRRWIEYEAIPPSVVDAVVAVEDDTFWTNQGFDPEAILAAVLSNYRNQEERPAGASTITQQLVRHIAFSYEERITPSYERKVKEIFLAFMLTRQRSKRDIVEMYLNEIYFGNLAYGIEAAAQTYFGKAATELSLAEAAFLAGLPQAPLDLDPYSHFEAAKSRQEFVLGLMVDEGMIDVVEGEAATAEPLQMASLMPAASEETNTILEAPHFVLYVQQLLESRYGPEALTRGGWQITTTLDLRLQTYVEQAAREWIASRAAQHDVNNAAVVVMKPGTGEILAMVGSLDYFNEGIDGQVNVALRPRQPGSSIKPVTYSAAMERGWNTGDVIWDVPIELDLGDGQKMTPRNYDGRFHGPLLLRDALANSYNIPPIQLIRDIGVPAFISTARKMGIESLTEPPGYYGLALTLGGGEVPLLEMTHAFATLANMGQRPLLTGVLEIVDSRGRPIYNRQSERLPAVNALDPRIAYIVTNILDDDAARVPGMGANNALALPFPAAAKTGTTNDFRDNWTLGYTPGVVVGVWAGNTDGHPMRDSSGLRGAAPLWRTIMTFIYDDLAVRQSLLVNGVMPPSAFTMPPGIEERQVCLPQGTGGSQCSASRKDLFLAGGPIHAVQRLGYVADTSTNPGAWTLSVASLPAGSAASLQQPPLDDGTQPPPVSLCVLNWVRPPEGAATRLFLPVPPYYADEVRARIWAQSHGYSMAPPVVCPGRAVQLASGSGSAGASSSSAAAPANTVWHIDSPGPGEIVSGVVPIVGTANFNPGEVQYYKLEIGSGQAPDSWTTFGTTHSQPVVGGVLETLHAYALPPGDYVIRLIVVRNDGNYPAPYSVPITIVP
jgi:membrane peptidoglycan carboxypeptidase